MEYPWAIFCFVLLLLLYKVIVVFSCSVWFWLSKRNFFTWWRSIISMVLFIDLHFQSLWKLLGLFDFIYNPLQTCRCVCNHKDDCVERVLITQIQSREICEQSPNRYNYNCEFHYKIYIYILDSTCCKGGMWTCPSHPSLLSNSDKKMHQFLFLFQLFCLWRQGASISYWPWIAIKDIRMFSMFRNFPLFRFHESFHVERPDFAKRLPDELCIKNI